MTAATTVSTDSSPDDMLKRWFGKTNDLKAPDPQKRLAAVHALPVERSAELADVARNDADQAVRVAAALKLTDLAALLAIARDNALDTTTQEAALDNIAQQLRQEPGSPTLVKALGEPAVLHRYLDNASADALEICIPYLKTAEQAALAVVRAKGALREQLIEHELLTTEEGLHTLEKVSRGRNKQANQHARRTLQEIRARQQALAGAESRLAEIDAAINRALAQDEPAAVQKLKTLHTTRQQIAADLADLNPHQPIAADPLADFDFDAAAAKSDANLRKLVQEVSTALLEGSFEHAISGISTVTEQLAALESPAIDLSEQIASLTGRVSLVEQALQSIAGPPWSAYERPQTLPGSPQLNTIAAHIEQRQAWIRQMTTARRAFTWPKDLPLPAVIETCDADLALVRRELDTLDDAVSRHVEELRQMMASVDTALEDQQYKQAVQAIKRVRNLHRKLGNLQPDRQETERRLGALSARIEELKDWQRFATNPKRKALLSDLELIANDPLEPAAQANRLRQLRSQWQALGRPASDEESSQQEQFDKLAEQAYEPCKAYFEEQGKQRAENLVARRALCTQLQDYIEQTDWASADFKAAEQILRAARDEWRRYHPCERDALKPVEAEFETLQKRLHGHIKAAWDSNIAVKRDIIAQAKSLLENEPVDAQVQGAKALQQQWREVGPLPRTTDQRLWKDFREVCDRIFASRDAERDAQTRARDESLAQAAEAIERLAASVAKRQAEGGATDAELRALNAEIDGIQAGVRLTRAMMTDIDKHRQAYRELIRQEKLRANADYIKQLQAEDERLAELERRGEALPEAESFDQKFRPRLGAHAASAGDGDADFLRMTLTAEIAAELPSPGNEAERLELQVELMNQGLRPGKDVWRELLDTWCASGPGSSDAQSQRDSLRERFFQAVATLSGN